jgi:hypothetical protein
MIDTLLTLFLFVLGSLLVGRSVMLACGRREWSGIEPAVGYATMVAAGGLLARIPGQDITRDPVPDHRFLGASRHGLQQ